MKCNNILEAIGHTPLVRLNRMAKDCHAEVYVKADYLNPGGSVKDRIGMTMIDDAERKGLLKPGGTIIEGTSGNTGMGLALVAAVRGYKMVFTITDKQSKEKVDLLKALGAEVIVCPTAVEPDDPRSYYSVAKKLAQEIPNSYYPNQYENPMNPEAHYRTTGPEIWEDSEGKITHFVCGMGTGGTISGVGRFLKEKNPDDQRSSAWTRSDRCTTSFSRPAKSARRTPMWWRALARIFSRRPWTSKFSTTCCK